MSVVPLVKSGPPPVRVNLEFVSMEKARHDLELLRTASQWGLHCLNLADTQGGPAVLAATRQLMAVTVELIKAG